MPLSHLDHYRVASDAASYLNDVTLDVNGGRIVM